MKKKLSFLLALLMIAVTGAWADTVVLGKPGESVTTLSDANGIVTITDDSGSTGIQQGSGSYKMTYDGTAYVPMKLSGSRNFTLSYKDGVTISKVTLLAMSNGDSDGTVGAGDGDATSLGTFPARNSNGNCLTVDITGKTGLRGSRQFLALIVVEYSTTAPSLNATPAELTFALNPNQTSKTQSFTLSGQNLTNGTYNLTVPTVEGLTVSPTSFTVAEGKVNQEVSVTYASTSDIAKAEAQISATVDEIPATVDITYQSRATAYTQSTVSADATWDWSKLTETAELTDDTTPSKSDEFLLADLDDRITFNNAFGDPTAIMMNYMQFPSRGGYAQGETIKFKTSVPGTISVVFSNTAGNRPYRYLFVNGEPTEFKSNTADWVTAEGINVPAGEVTLTAWLPTDGDESTNIKDGAGSMLRWQKITFTASQEPVEEPTEKTWQQATSIAVGDVVLITNTDASKELKEISNNIGVVDAYESKPAGLLPLTVVAGSSTASASYAFQTKDGKYLAWSGGNTLTTSDEVNENSSWTVTFTEEGVPTIANVKDGTRKLQYNQSNPRFCAYTSLQKPVTFWKQVEVAADTRTATTLTIAEAPTTGETGTTIALPTATVTAGEAEVSGATVTWTSDNEEVAKIEGSNINLLKAGTAKITASYAGDDTYKESTANFTLTVTDAPYKTLKALQEAVTDASTPANISLSNVQVVFVNGSNAYLTDTDGYGVLIYTNGHGLEVGQVLNGTISCKFILYQGNTEITNFSKKGLTITNADVTPVERTLPLTTANQSTLVTLKNLTYNANAKTLSDGTNTITFYDKFKTDVTLEDGKTYDVTGIVVMYNTTNNSTIEICPRTAADVVEATPVTPTEDTYVVAGAIKVGEGDEEAGFFGTTKWDGTAEANKMVEQNGTYSITYNDVEFTANTTILYKIVKNENEWIPDNNKWYDITAGTYDITFTYDPNATEGDGISFNATLKINSVFAAGNGSEGWLNNETWASDAEANEMVEVTDGIWEITYENVPQSNDLEVKFTLNGTWDNNFGNATTENFTAFGEATAATYNGKNIVFATDGVKNIKLQLDLTEFDYTTRLGAKFTISLEDAEEPSGDVTATWDFTGETPTPATLTKVNVQSGATYYPSDNDVAALYVNALNGKLAYTNDQNGYAQFNNGTILRVPVYTTDDVVTVTAFPGQYKYKVGNTAASENVTEHTATSAEVSQGYVEIVATGSAYLRTITLKTTKMTVKHAVWNFLNEIPTTITGTKINFTTGSVPSSVEGIALDVNGYLKARGTDGWIYTNTTMNVPVKTEGDIVTVMAYSTQYDNYTVGGKDASNSESPIFTYKATATDATNGYVTIATSDQQAYIYAISVQQLPVKEPTTLDNEPATVTFPFDLGTEGQKATFSEGDANYFLNSKVAWGSNFTVNGTCTVSGITETQLKATAKEKAAAESNLIKFTFTPKPGFTFTPTKVTFTATRVGTNGGKLDVAWYNSNKTNASLETGFTPNRDNDATQPYSTKIYDLTTATGIVAGEGECGLQFNLYNLDGGKNYGFANIIIEGTLSGTEQELPILASFKVNETEYAVEDVFGDGYEATLELSKTETIVSESNPLTEITATSGEVGNVVYADATDSSCKVTIPVTAGSTTLEYVLNVVHKPDFTLQYISVDGTTVLEEQTVEKDAKIGEFAYNIANVEASKEGYKARGWFKNNYVGEKWTTESTITADAKLYAVETEIEVSSDSKRYEFDLTDKNFDADDHEAFNPTGSGAWHDNQHGWVFAKDDKIDLLVGGKASIILGLCQYSTQNIQITASNGKTVDAYNENDGATATIEYEGEPGTLTLTFNGTTYLHKLTIFNTTTTNYEQDGEWIIVKEGDGSSLVDALFAAKEGTRIFLPKGTYDLGQKTLTTIGSNNVSIIGESMEGVIIKNRPVKEGIAITATLLNKGTNLYMQDLTLDCIAPYGTGDDTKSAERGVTLQDQGDQTILKNVYLKGLQDTYYSNNPSGTYYFEDGKVEGSVDYVCGNGDVYFNKTLFYTVNKSTGTKGGCIAAPNTRKDFGYIFNECTLDGVANEDGQYRLGRPWAADTKCLFVNTTMKIKPVAEGWGDWSPANPVKQFAEYNSKDAEGNVISLDGRKTLFNGVDNNPVLTETEAAALAPDVIFNGEWRPQVIATQVAAPKAKLSNDGKKIEWTPANDGATAYAIFKDGKFLGITTGTEWSIEEEAAPAPRRTGEEAEATTTGYTIRAANSRGGFGPAADVSPATGIAAIEAELGGDVKIYDLNGRRVMTPTKGVYIINGKKTIIK